MVATNRNPKAILNPIAVQTALFHNCSNIILEKNSLTVIISPFNIGTLLRTGELAPPLLICFGQLSSFHNRTISKIDRNPTDKLNLSFLILRRGEREPCFAGDPPSP